MTVFCSCNEALWDELSDISLPLWTSFTFYFSADFRWATCIQSEPGLKLTLTLHRHLIRYSMWSTETNCSSLFEANRTSCLPGSFDFYFARRGDSPCVLNLEPLQRSSAIQYLVCSPSIMIAHFFQLDNFHSMCNSCAALFTKKNSFN